MVDVIKNIPDNDDKVSLSLNQIGEIVKGNNLTIFEFSDKYLRAFEKNKENLSLLLNIKVTEYLNKSFKGKGLYGLKISERILSEKKFNGKNLEKFIYQDINNQLEEKGLYIKNLKSLEIISGKLHIRLDNGDFLSYNLIAKNIEDLVLPNKTKKDLDNLKEEQDVVTKIVMWGSLVTLTYSQFVEFGEWGDKAIDKTSRNFGDMKKQKFLKEIEIETDKGKKIKVDITEKIVAFGENKVGQVELRNILKKQGVVFNPEKNQFEETTSRRLNKAVEAIEYKSIVKRIKSYSFLEYKAELLNAGVSNSERLTEVEFEKAKKDNIKILKELNNEFNAGKNKNLRFGTYLKGKYMGGFFQRIGGNALHVIMMPIFFKEIHKHSGNLDSYVKGGVEVATFMAGAKFGGKIPGPALLKMITGILVGGAAAVGGHETLKHFDRELLKSMPNREDYFKRIGFEDSAEFAGWALGGFVNDIADGLNTDVGMNFNKVFGFFNSDWDDSKSFDIDLFNNNISLGTSMIDYLNERTRGVEHWNKEVEEFKLRATREINSKILSKEFKYSDVFEDDNIFYYKHSFEENIYDALNTVKKFKKEFLNDHGENASKKIAEFSKNNIPKDLLLGTFTDSKDPDNTKVFDKIKDKLKVFLKENKILTKTEDIEKFTEYYESIFYDNISKKIDEILGNPNAIESLLGSSGDIHNTTKNIKDGLKRNIIKGYYSQRLETNVDDIVESEDNKVTKNIDKSIEIERNKTYTEIELGAEIDKLKIDDFYIKEYDEIIVNDGLLLDRALDGKINKDSILYIGDYIFIADENGKYYRSYGDVKDLIYISNLSEKDRKFTQEIFKKILNPKYGNLLRGKGTVYLNEKKKFKKLLENDKYYIFFNRMIDFKRRKVFIENIKKHNDSVEWDIENSVVLNVREAVSDSVDYILSTKTIKETLNEKN